MPKKPSNLIYGVDEKPPLWLTIFMGFQHICIYAISLAFPVIIIREMGGTTEQAAFMISMSMIAGGIGPIIMALATATLMAIFLNLIFRIGIAKSQTIELEPGVDSSEKIFNFMERTGSSWGARREVIYRAISVMNEFLESVTTLGLAKGKLKVVVSFDEFNLDINIFYDGALIELPENRPSEDELLKGETAFIRLSGFLIRSQVDRVKLSIKDDECHIHFHFDH